MRRYSGILWIDRDMAAHLCGGGRGEIWDARLAGETLTIRWRGGRSVDLPWTELGRRKGLEHLPAPIAAFVVGQEKVGLLFSSTTPLPGLQFVEPHSVVFPIGTLTRDGIRAEA